MTSPKVSIAIPLYNVAPYLAQCLLSIQDQTIQDFEVIMVDDGSSDDTRTIAQAKTAEDSRFHLLCNERNQGAYATKLRGMSAAQGMYVWQIDGDDYIPPDALETYIRTIEQDGCGMVRARYLVDTDGCLDNPLMLRPWQATANASVAEHPDIYALPGGSCLNFMPRTLVQQSPFPQSLAHNNMVDDVVINAALFSHVKTISLIDDITYYYRLHDKGITGSEHSFENTVHGLQNIILACDLMEAVPIYTMMRIVDAVQWVQNALIAMIQLDADKTLIIHCIHCIKNIMERHHPDDIIEAYKAYRLNSDSLFQGETLEFIHTVRDNSEMYSYLWIKQKHKL